RSSSSAYTQTPDPRKQIGGLTLGNEKTLANGLRQASSPGVLYRNHFINASSVSSCRCWTSAWRPTLSQLARLEHGSDTCSCLLPVSSDAAAVIQVFTYYFSQQAERDDAAFVMFPKPARPGLFYNGGSCIAANITVDDVACRLDIQLLGDILADQLQGIAARTTGARLGLCRCGNVAPY